MATDVLIGVIGGTGVDQALGLEGERQELIETPFGSPSSAITLAQWEGVRVAVLKRHGEGHILNPSRVPFRANIFALKALGVTHLVATGATGSLRDEFSPCDLVIPDQIIDRTRGRAATFYESAAVHVAMAEPFCPVVRQWLLGAAGALGGVRVHPRGTYVCMEGPAFSTRAESLMHRQWGGDLIGMTAMPEAKLAREAEIAYGMIALPTDFDCWRPRDPGARGDVLSEIIENLQKVTARGLELLKSALRDVSILLKTPSPAHQALRHAIWSEKSRIGPDEIERLAPLWGRYFRGSAS